MSSDLAGESSFDDPTPDSESGPDGNALMAAGAGFVGGVGAGLLLADLMLPPPPEAQVVVIERMHAALPEIQPDPITLQQSAPAVLS